jgi:hypothetical protein
MSEEDARGKRAKIELALYHFSIVSLLVHGQQDRRWHGASQGDQGNQCPSWLRRRVVAFKSQPDETPAEKVFMDYRTSGKPFVTSALGGRGAGQQPRVVARGTVVVGELEGGNAWMLLRLALPITGPAVGRCGPTRRRRGSLEW